MTTLDVSRRGITTAIRNRVFDRIGGNLCAYCGCPATEIDHIVPRSRGGGLDDDNLAPVCFECNNQKRDQTPEEWAVDRQSRGLPWPIPSYNSRILFLHESGYFPTGMEDWLYAQIREWIGNNFETLRADLVALRDCYLDSF